MPLDYTVKPPSQLTVPIVALFGVLLGTIAGFASGSQPFLLGAIFAVSAVLFLFFRQFEGTVLFLLVTRSTLDAFSELQLPVLLALCIDGLTLLYLMVQFFQHRPIRVDRFWWFFAGWVLLQGLWVILTSLGWLSLGPTSPALSGDPSLASYIRSLDVQSLLLLVNVREWIRLFSFVIIYLLVLQMQGRITPERLISALFLSLLLPIVAAYMQEFLPAWRLPPILALAQEGRVRGTFGHANSFSLFVLLFMGITWWKITWSQKRWPWILLLVGLAVAYVGTHALASLETLAVVIFVLSVRKIKLKNALVAVLVFSAVLGLFASTDFGRERIGMLSQTPLLNPSLESTEAIALLYTDSDFNTNSFNWRLAHWGYLMQSWQRSPVLGFGLATSTYMSPFLYYFPHNDWVRSLVEGGVVGFSLYVLFLLVLGSRLIYLFRLAQPDSPHQDFCWLLFAVFVASVIQMFTDNIWICTAFYFYWWTVVAIAGWKWESVVPHTEISKRVTT
jgi:O-antigen ligase